MVDLNREFLTNKYECLINLTDINLACSQIRRIDSNVFQELTKLETLWLNDNEIEVIDVRSFESLSNLKELRLYNNKLKEINRRCFEPLKSIEVILLYENAGLNYLSFIKPSTNFWYDEEKVEKYGSVSDWNTFLQQFTDLEISVDSSKQSSSSSFGLNLYERFEKIKIIGSGAYGIVYKVKDRHTGQHKAMKAVKYIDQRSENEFENMMKINHENLVKYFDHFYHTIDYIEHICIITEYCENGDLERKIYKLIAEKKNLSEERIFDWTLQATNGLKYLHSDSVRMVHRDIKPENILLSNEDVVKLADLGISKVLSGTIARTFVANVSYMSPELERCKDAEKEEGKSYSFNTDVWSLGCVLYELIHLNKAFPQGFGAVKIIPNLTGCGNFTNILKKMLVTDPNNRFSSKELYDLMMKSYFDIKEDSSNEKERREQEAKEKEQRERQEREALARLRIDENIKGGETIIGGESVKRFQDPFTGTLLNDRYKVVKRIGKGSFGSVYLVDDTQIDIERFKRKAMKIMDQLDSSTENELFLFFEINHENIVRYFDHFHKKIEGENQTFLITEYCENGDLKNKIEEAERLDRNFNERQILDWIYQATNALKYLHSKKPDPIIHRDIKPANMLLTRRNEIKLADLGLSKIMDSISHASSHAGTPVYMSPEVFKAQFMDIHYYPNTDIWSLGCVLYELIFLTKAFPRGQRSDPPIPSNVSSCGIFSSILPKMLEKDCLVRISSRQLLIELLNLSDINLSFNINKFL